MDAKTITVQAVIDAPLEQVWKAFTTAEDIVQWNQASEDWHTPRAENDLKSGGRFRFRSFQKDRYGVSWQIVPFILPKLMNDPASAGRATKAFMQMKKMDIEFLQQA